MKTSLLMKRKLFTNSWNLIFFTCLIIRLKLVEYNGNTSVVLSVLSAT